MLVMYTKFFQVMVERLRACLGKPIDVTFVFAELAKFVSIFRTLRYFIITQGIKAG